MNKTNDEICKKITESVYKNIDKKNYNIEGWSYNSSPQNPKSGFYSEIYKKDGNIIFAIRGTDNEWQDVKNDLQIGLSSLPKQAKDAEKVYKQLLKDYNWSDIKVTGHSLGGTLATIIGSKYGVDTVTFNAYGAKYLKGMDIKYTNNITNYGNANDLVFTLNIDGQIGKTIILNAEGSGNTIARKNQNFSSEAHKVENLGDLSKGIEYKKEEFEKQPPLFKLSIQNENFDQIFDDKNRVFYDGEIQIEDMNKEQLDTYLEQLYSQKKMPSKLDLNKQTNLGNLIYVKDYVRSDGTKVSGYYRRK